MAGRGATASLAFVSHKNPRFDYFDLSEGVSARSDTRTGRKSLRGAGFCVRLGARPRASSTAPTGQKTCSIVGGSCAPLRGLGLPRRLKACSKRRSTWAAATAFYRSPERPPARAAPAACPGGERQGRHDPPAGLPACREGAARGTGRRAVSRFKTRLRARNYLAPLSRDGFERERPGKGRSCVKEASQGRDAESPVPSHRTGGEAPASRSLQCSGAPEPSRARRR